ncbi:alkyl hydroperoxide reductase [Sphingobacterium faecium NBRC 15299]|uniref:TlpA family protein disulfide reductase n=1 Tax=Sphingobacterium faecium TaxID=34087 RepID=UPI000D3868D6|nr:TlpA disulfide reductase family protein [Sphingobacterium faecium]GEM64900.1 alkyl hydroperoxide reductase [Sphingobacterium faecium NBRC 15299]
MITHLNKKMIGMFLVVTSITAVSCNSQTKDNPNSQAVETTVDSAATSPTSQANEVSFIDENGKDITLSSLKGKVVFINFWATWCPPCIHEMPSINSLKQSFKENNEIIFLMVDVDGMMDKSKAFMAENKYDLQVYAPHGEIPSEFLGNAIPTTVILNKKGELVDRLEGGRDYADPAIKKSLDKLIQIN